MTLESSNERDKLTTPTSIVTLSSSLSRGHHLFHQRRFPKTHTAEWALILLDLLHITQRKTEQRREQWNQISSRAKFRGRSLNQTRPEKITSLARPTQDPASTTTKTRMIERTSMLKARTLSSSLRSLIARTLRLSTLKILDQECMRKRWEAPF